MLIFKVKILVVTCCLFLSSNLLADDKYISDGQLFVDEEKGFSIMPPVGWEVLPNYPNLSFLAQVPHTKGVFQRSIQLMVFNESRFIDDISASDFGEILVKKFSKVNSSMEGYRLNNYALIDLQNNRKGIIYYTQFTLNEKELMQAHILLSSQDRHYLVTYTDLKEFFDDTSEGSVWNEAWRSMSSIKIEGKTPKRYSKYFYFGIPLILLTLIFSVYVLYQRRKDKQLSSLTDDFENDEPSSDFDEIGDSSEIDDLDFENSDEDWLMDDDSEQLDDLSDEEKEDFWKK